MWIISKGYDVTDISKRQALQEGLLEQLSAVTDVAALRAAVLDALTNKGCAFKVKKKGRLVGCYVLVRETMDAAPLNEAAAQTEIKPLEGNEQQVLRLTVRAVLPEHEAAITDLEHHDDMKAELHNLLIDGHTRAVYFGDLTVTPRKGGFGGRSASGMALGMCVGIMLGVAMKNIGVGLCFGVAFAASFGAMGADRKGD